MTKAELIEALAEEAELTKRQAGDVVAILLDLITETLRQGEKVQLTPFGLFEVRSRKKRKGRNPKTGASLVIPARKHPAFRAGRSLRTAIGGEKKKGKR